MKKNRNAGFSLVEVIVVIAIMGVLIGMASTGISLLFSRDAEKCAMEIESGLDKLRTYTMSKKGSWYMKIEQDGANYLMTIYRDEGTGEAVYEQINLGSKVTLAPTEIRLQFNRVTGGVAYVDIAGSGWTTPGDMITIQVDSNRTNRSKTVNIVKLTGRHFIE